MPDHLVKSNFECAKRLKASNLRYSGPGVTETGPVDIF